MDAKKLYKKHLGLNIPKGVYLSDGQIGQYKLDATIDAINEAYELGKSSIVVLPKPEIFEYVDRNTQSNVVQMGTFYKIVDINQVKKGDRLICPAVNEPRNGRIHTNNHAGIVDIHSNKPILCFVKNVTGFHIGYAQHENSKSNGEIAWDLCYILKVD